MTAPLPRETCESLARACPECRPYRARKNPNGLGLCEGRQYYADSDEMRTWCSEYDCGELFPERWTLVPTLEELLALAVPQARRIMLVGPTACGLWLFGEENPAPRAAYDHMRQGESGDTPAAAVAAWLLARKEGA